MAVAPELRGLIAPQAAPLTLGLAGLAALAGAGSVWLGSTPLALVSAVLLALSAGNLLFFRIPRRVSPPGERLVLSPADGRVLEVCDVEDPEGYVGKARRIAIFLSIANAHINWSPVSGRIVDVRRSGSRFLAAFRSGASEWNVQTRVDLETPAGVRLAVVQITGLVARRIVCYPRPGAVVERGEPYGLMCYGSRMEVYVPARSRVLVEAGARVRGARDAIAELPA